MLNSLHPSVAVGALHVNYREMTSPMRLFCFFVFALFHLSALALDNSYRIEQAYQTQAVKPATPDMLAPSEFKPYSGDLRLGYSHGSTWIQLKIMPTSSASRISSSDQGTPAVPLVLRVGPYLLNVVELHQKVDGHWVMQRKGDRRPQKTAFCLEDVHCFVLHGAPDQAQTVLLRLENAGIMFVQTQVLPLDAAVQAMSQQAAQRSVFLTVAVGLLVLGLLYLTVEFSALLVIYCLYQLSVVFSVVASMGLISSLLTHWTPAAVSVASSIFLVLRVTLTVVLLWAMVASYKPSDVSRRLVMGLLLLCGVNVMLVLLGHARLALPLNLLVFCLNPVVNVLGLLSSQGMHRRRRYVLLGWDVVYMLVVGFGLLNVLSGMSLQQRGDWLQYFGDWRLSGGLIGLVFFWAVVTEQKSRNTVKRQDLEQLRLLAEQARSEAEKFSERHALIDMLTHELKTPLGAIKFALATLKRQVQSDAEVLQRIHTINACVKRMDNLIEHVARADKVEMMKVDEIQVEVIAPDELLQDLIGDYASDNFVLLIEKGTAFQSNRQMLLVIFENLLSNAYKYSAPGHKIKVNVSTQAVDAVPLGSFKQLAKTGKLICFEISNHIPADAEPDESRLFERYYRHPSVQSKPGLGIGLSLVQSAARKIGASVAYRRQSDQVFFTIKVPL